MEQERGGGDGELTNDERADQKGKQGCRDLVCVQDDRLEAPVRYSGAGSRTPATPGRIPGNATEEFPGKYSRVQETQMLHKSASVITIFVGCPVTGAVCK